jgi:hypothetical protein
MIESVLINSVLDDPILQVFLMNMSIVIGMVLNRLIQQVLMMTILRVIDKCDG